MSSGLMTVLDADVLVLGAGFGGSLLSRILQVQGRQCVLVDKSAHPRFSIGESSTPLADFVLFDLARRYDFRDVLPLASYGSWKSAHPDIRCGLKRGFSYFHHVPDRRFCTDQENFGQLLVAASSNDADSDTHWHRGDVDSFLFRGALDAGVTCFEHTRVKNIARSDRWRVTLAAPHEQFEVRSRFVIDATGADGVLLSALGIGTESDGLRTRSRAVFGHFSGVRLFSDVLGTQGVDSSVHPYACDDSALHHVGDRGWMWVLRLSDSLVSAGCVLPPEEIPDGSPPDQFGDWLQKYPSIAEQFASAEVRPDPGFVRTARLQRLRTQAAGDGWFALPNSVGFIDPLHSTGIAHTLSAVERIAVLFERGCEADAAAWTEYCRSVRCELRFVDELVSGCYAGMGNPDAFRAWCMLYFAAAHSCELRRLQGERAFVNGFLGAGMVDLRRIVRDLRPRLDAAVQSGTTTDARELEARIGQSLGAFNQAGLCDPSVRNMYSNTAPPRNLGLA